jgi:enoyl-CoA hydratase/carnithine racemase
VPTVAGTPEQPGRDEAAPHVDLERRDDVVWAWMNRPEALNAFNEAMLDEAIDKVETLATDATVAAVVLIGRGRAFCTGVDVKSLHDGSLGMRWFESWQRLVAALEGLPMPLIAAIRGYCLGGGLMLALASDYRVATDDLQIGLSAVRHGIIPGSATYRLADVAGAGTARRLCLFAEHINAEEALRLNLVDRVVPAASLENVAATLAARVSGFPAHAVRATKRLVVTSSSSDVGEVERAYLDAQAGCLDQFGRD